MLPDRYTILPGDQEAQSLFRTLLDHGLVEGINQSVVKCINPSDRDFVGLSTEGKKCANWLYVDDFENGSLICDHCKRDIYLIDKTEKNSAIVVRLLINKIVKFVEKTLRQYVNHIDSIDSDYSWLIHYKNRTAIISLLEYSPFKLMYEYLCSEKETIIGVAITNRMYSRFKSRFPTLKVISLQTILENPRKIDAILDAVVSDKPSKLRIDACKERFLKHAATFDSTGVDFEVFCKSLEEYVFSNVRKLQSFLGILEAYKLVAYRTINLGGPGKPDLVRLSLFDYFRDYITHCGSIEVKQYLQSRLRIEDISKAAVIMVLST